MEDGPGRAEAAEAGGQTDDLRGEETDGTDSSGQIQRHYISKASVTHVQSKWPPSQDRSRTGGSAPSLAQCSAPSPGHIYIAPVYAAHACPPANMHTRKREAAI